MMSNKPISEKTLELARKAFLSVPKSFTIRAGKVAGSEQFDQRLERVINAIRAADRDEGGVA